jgi:hypothetical protein
MINFEKRYGPTKEPQDEPALPQTLPEAQSEILRLCTEQKILFDMIEQLQLRLAITGRA